jgi:hypothetical protein
VTDDELAALEAAADRPRRRERPWGPPFPAPDGQVRAGDLERGLWLLHEAHQQLVSECSEQRRRGLVSTDPVDAIALRTAAGRVEAALLDLDAATVPDEQRDERHAYREQVVSLLNAATPGAADLYLRAVEDAADAQTEADRLQDQRDPGAEYDRLSLRALYDHPSREQRRTVLWQLAGHLIAVGTRPGVALGLLEAWDEKHNHPPVGPDEVERALRAVASRHADKLEGIAA